MNRNTNIIKITAALMCCIVFGSIFLVNSTNKMEKESIVVEADKNSKEYKWTKKVIEKCTTVNAQYLWPDETNPVFTAVYRDGKRLPDEKMVTITEGSVYHFRGSSDKSILYTEVYVGGSAKSDITTSELGTWYNLLPSAVRTSFESEGWTWKIGWEYTGRAYLDIENKRVMIKENDPTAVLYGVGLYLDSKYTYSSDVAFTQEETDFINKFGDTDNVFASALECYYTKGGELQNTCPEIYSTITSKIIKSNTKISKAQKPKEQKPETQKPKAQKPKSTESDTVIPTDEPVLMKELLTYVNKQRKQAGLSKVTWDKANDDNTAVRVKEITQKLSQTRPDGTDAFSAYTDSVKCEIRMADIYEVKTMYENAENYFLMKDLKAINCAVYENMGVLIFIW